MTDAVQERISELVKANDIVLFMKGTPAMPQCGFSATVIGLLNEVGVNFDAHNVLEDPQLRDGVKAFANWPTIPQLYVKGEFQGGCDIVKELYAGGQLHALLGAEAPTIVIPKITLSTAAEDKLKEAATGAKEDEGFLKLEVDQHFNHNLYFSAKGENDVAVDTGTITFIVSPMATTKVDGISIDYAIKDTGEGFVIKNPNAPEKPAHP